MVSASLSAARRFLRPTWAEIDPNAFRRNLTALAGVLAPGVRMIVVLKADGYGHGAVPLARAAAALPGLPLWGFGVSSVEEGQALREAGLKTPVLILGSLFPFDAFEVALRHDLTPTVASLAAAQALERTAGALKRRAAAHVKIDTGMGRIGVSPKAAAQTLEAVLKSPSLRLEGVYTHLAQADSAEVTRNQLDLFEQAVAPLRAGQVPFLAHVANSAAVLRHPRAHLDAVRPGLALYGICPSEDLRSRADLSPVMAWKTRVVFLKTVQPGTPVSYGGTFRFEKAARVATLPVGYADGYRRSLSNKGQVLVRGRRCPVVGRVTMDQILVDVTQVPGVDVGDEAVLLGAQGRDRISAEELARWADTIPYEIVCGVSARVPRVLLE